MSHANNYIIAPVQLEGDIWPMLGVTGDLGYAITHGSINRWALWRPVQVNVNRAITLAERLAAYCGLTPKALPKMLRMSYGYEVGSYSDTEAEVIAEIAEWAYTKPTSHFRMLDFTNPSSPSTLIGYSATAIAPDANWQNWTLTSSDKTIAMNASVTVTSETVGSRAVYTFTVPSGIGVRLYQGFAMMFGLQSGQKQGDCSGMQIPISYITDSLFDSTEDWRLALAIALPNTPSATHWAIFPAPYRLADCYNDDGSFKTGRSIADCLPNLAINKAALSLMTAGTTYHAVPILVNGLGVTYINNLLAPRAVADVTTLYCTPSGQGEINIVLGSAKPQQYVVLTSSITTTSSWYFTNHSSDTIYGAGYIHRITVNGNVQTITGVTGNIQPGGVVSFENLPHTQYVTHSFTMVSQIDADGNETAIEDLEPYVG